MHTTNGRSVRLSNRIIAELRATIAKGREAQAMTLEILSHPVGVPGWPVDCPEVVLQRAKLAEKLQRREHCA
jgi:hypothetical protein